MGEIKLFRINKENVVELEGESAALERSLQRLIEKHLEDFLGVRFLATEYSTGKTHRGRIDTLGIDENGCPVIIEYKASMNENVINQGLFYLNWLMDHQAEFELLVIKVLGKEGPKEISWSSPRLICIAGDFSRYDEHAVQQMNMNIELVRYRHFGEELLLFELFNVVSSESSDGEGPTKGKSWEKTAVEDLETSSPELQDLFKELKASILALGDDVQMKTLKYYFAFRRFKNFACVQIFPQAKKVVVWLKVDPTRIEEVPGFTRNVKEVGHYGTGDLEVTLKSSADLQRAMPLILESYDSS